MWVILVGRKMAKKRYCAAQHCVNFVGTTSDEVHMFRCFDMKKIVHITSHKYIIAIIYRFPLEKEIKDKWIDAINKNNDEKSRTNGIGFLCDQHFLSNDVQKHKGRLKLKNGAIPVNFVSSTDQTILEPVLNNNSVAYAQTNNSTIGCTECSALTTERDELKRILIQTNIDSEINLQKEREKFKKYVEKCEEKSNEIRLLKEQLRYWKAKQSEYIEKINSLKAQLKSTTKGIGLEVNVNYSSTICFNLTITFHN